MVWNKCPIIGQQVVLSCVAFTGYHSNNLTPNTPLILALSASDSKTSSVDPSSY